MSEVKEPVICELKSYVSRIVLNNPERGNVVNNNNLELLYKFVKESNDNPDCRVIVIEGKDGVFCRGMDFQNLIKNADNGVKEEWSEPYIRAVMEIRNSSKPVIASIDGDVLAGGMGIALACDIVLATKRSNFGLSEVIFGIIPAYVFPFLLERVNFKKSRFMVLSSRKFTAEESFGLGVVDDIADDDKLEKKLKEYLKRLLSSSPDALALVKRYSDDINGQNIKDAAVVAQQTLTALLNQKKNIDAIKSFLEGDSLEWVVKYKP